MLKGLTLLIFMSTLVKAEVAHKFTVKIFKNEKPVSSGMIISKIGHEAELIRSDANGRTAIKLTANHPPKEFKKGIFLNMYITIENEKIKKRSLNPQVIVYEGKEAIFETMDLNEDEKIVVKVKTDKVKI